MPDPGPGPSTLSHASIVGLKALTAEHVDRFAKQGKAPVRGQPRGSLRADKPKDPFDRPSPGLVKRLAAEARNDAKRRHFQDEGGPSDDQRREILKAKALKYDAIRRGDYSALSKKELDESVIDFERKLEEEGYSDGSSDEDGRARSPRRLSGSEDEENSAKIEYVDELGRTRMGTRKEARAAAQLRRKDLDAAVVSTEPTSSYAEVLQSNVIHGDQNFFPVYEPDLDSMREKYRAAEEEARAHHYDSTKEVRNRGAGAYQFSLDEEQRAEQMASLAAQREETERVRASTGSKDGLSAAQEAHKRKLDDRRALIEAQRAKRKRNA